MIEQSGDSYETDNDLSNTARLGFNEIIPGLSSGSEGPNVRQDTGPLIPEFDLGKQMMAQHRRAAAAKRRGPGQQKQADAECASHEQDACTQQAQVTWPTISVPRHNAIIADIVARDLARLCGAAWHPSESS